MFLGQFWCWKGLSGGPKKRCERKIVFVKHPTACHAGALFGTNTFSGLPGYKYGPTVLPKRFVKFLANR